MKPRIVQLGKFYPPYMGGIETHLEALCSQLQGRFDLQVVASNTKRRRECEVREGIPVTRLATPFSITSAPVSMGFSDVLRAARPDLVHIHLPHPSGILGLLASNYRGPLVVTYHSDVVRQRVMSLAFHPFLSTLLRRASTIIVTSPNYLATSPVLRAHRLQCRVVPYGIHTGRFGAVSASETAAIRARFGQPLILAVGRLVYYKGFEVLVDAMATTPGHLLIIGGGPLEAPLRERVRRRGLDQRVTLLGEVQNEHTAPYFTAADVFVLPSVARSEAFGIVQLEAMASGTPVVNTLLESGVPWVSLDGVTGLTVPPGDAGALAVAIGRLLEDSDLRAKFSAAARLRVASEFTVERMGARISAIYEAALSHRPAPEAMVALC